MKVALIGCGSIGRVIAESIAEKKVDMDLAYIYDISTANIKEVISLFENPPTISANIEEIADSPADLVVEAASVNVARKIIPLMLEARKDLMIMSIGALADNDFREKTMTRAEEMGNKIYLPSGAIGSLDALKSANMAKIESVTIKTTKNPGSLKGAPFFSENPMDLDNLKEATLIYKGSARDAIQKFPANVNVSVALSLAGIGPEKTMVEIVADPDIKTNSHEIHVKGDFGSYHFRTENLPSPDNPKTSYLAALSAIATLKNIVLPIKIGT